MRLFTSFMISISIFGAIAGVFSIVNKADTAWMCLVSVPVNIFTAIYFNSVQRGTDSNES